MEKLVLYTTTQTHSLGKKAGLVLGLKVRALEVTAEDDFALRGETLEMALKEDVNAGLHPFILGMLYQWIAYHRIHVIPFGKLLQSGQHLPALLIGSVRLLMLVRTLTTYLQLLMRAHPYAQRNITLSCGYTSMPHGQASHLCVLNIARHANFPPSILTQTHSVPISTRFLCLIVSA
jgi:hypothetical protein